MPYQHSRQRIVNAAPSCVFADGFQIRKWLARKIESGCESFITTGCTNSALIYGLRFLELHHAAYVSGLTGLSDSKVLPT